MRNVVKGLMFVAALAAAMTPAAAFAKGGGGAAQPICINGGCQATGTNFTLKAPIGPDSAFLPFDAPNTTGEARYDVKGAQRTLTVNVKGLDPLDGRQVVVLIDGALLTNATVSSTGT